MGGLLNRRQFMGASAAGAGMIMAGGKLTDQALANQVEQWPPRMPPVNIYKVYIGS